MIRAASSPQQLFYVPLFLYVNDLATELRPASRCKEFRHSLASLGLFFGGEWLLLAANSIARCGISASGNSVSGTICQNCRTASSRTSIGIIEWPKPR